MKTKLITIALMSVILVACGKTDKEKREEATQAKHDLLIEKRIEVDNKAAVYEAENAMTMYKPVVVEYLAKNGKCSGDAKEYGFSEPVLKYVKNIYFSKDCTIHASFKESPYNSNLNGQELILKLTSTPEKNVWVCTFTGQNKKYIPKMCQ